MRYRKPAVRLFFPVPLHLLLDPLGRHLHPVPERRRRRPAQLVQDLRVVRVAPRPEGGSSFRLRPSTPCGFVRSYARSRSTSTAFSITSTSSLIVTSVRMLPLVAQHAMIESIADVKPCVLPECIQVGLNSLNVSSVFGLDEHADYANTRDLEVLGPCPTLLLIHDQQRRIRLYGQRDGFGLASVQILTNRTDEIPIRDGLRFDPRCVPDRFCPRLSLTLNDNLVPDHPRKRHGVVER